MAHCIRGSLVNPKPVSLGWHILSLFDLAFAYDILLISNGMIL